jgi:DNA end-binding protein Ku
MRAIWKGSISFGLVSIPISLYPAATHDELKFRLLRSPDLSPINYKRVAETDGKEVPWDKIVKGYEYEKGKFVVLKDEDFARVDVEATQTVDIMHFVKLDELNPMLFYKPYFMEVGKGGDRAYALLCEALAKSGKVAIAKVVIKTRQYLAAIKPQDKALILELMHFPHELQDSSDFKSPAAKTIAKPEMNMALQLIDSMSAKWNPDDYQDDYHLAVEKMIEQKIESGDKKAAPIKKPAKTKPATDLVAVLQQSLKSRKSTPPPAITRGTSRQTKSAARAH